MGVPNGWWLIQSINLTINSSAYPDSFEYGQSEASRFYEYIFGYRPPIWKLLASRFSGNETIYSYDFCLGDGVSTGFVIGGAAQVLMGDVDLRYNSRCEPPYCRFAYFRELKRINDMTVKE